MKKLHNSILAAVVVVSAATALRGQNAGSAPAAAPVPVGRVSVESISAVNGFLKDLGLSPPPLADMIEQRVPMPLEKGSVAEDQPLGVVLMAGNKLPTDMSSALGSVVFAVPVAPGKLSEAELKKNGGAEAVKNQPGVLATTTMGLRRTSKYLLGQLGKPAGLGAVPADPFAADYKDKSNLAVMSVNVAALRKVLGPKLKQMASQTAPGAATSPAVDFKGGVLSASALLGFLNSTDKLTVAVAHDPQNVHLRTWVSPFSLTGGAAPQSLPRPNFPNGVFAEVHLNYAGADAASWVNRAVDVLPDQAPGLAPEEARPLKDATKKLLLLYAGGDALSLGVASKAGGPVVYLVSQLHDNIDYKARISDIADKLRKVDNQFSDVETITVSTYDLGGKNVVRFLTRGSGTPTVCIDCIQDGKKLFVTIATDEGHFVGDLASAGMGPPSNLLVAGALDIEGLVQHLEQDGPLAPMPDQVKKALEKGFAGQTVTWSAQVIPDQKSLLVQLHVPKAALKMLTTMKEMEAPVAPATGPMPGPAGQ